MTEAGLGRPPDGYPGTRIDADRLRPLFPGLELSWLSRESGRPASTGTEPFAVGILDRIRLARSGTATIRHAASNRPQS